ncbi:MAG: HD domain-containing protein [Gammaproteobacteria bacterium]|nr:HD domain-containing protein [Gammaproteobacteria bacterium]
MKFKSSIYRVVFLYISSLFFISLYGGQVCPYIDGLEFFELTLPISLIVALQYILHRILIDKLISQIPLEKQVSRYFKTELTLFVLSGFLLTFSNAILYDFPLVSGIKMILGFVTLGMFISVDLSLSHERALALYMKEQNIQLKPNENYFPLVGKFAVFATAIIILIVAIFLLVTIKDLDWLIQVGNEIPLTQAKISIMKEFIFIGSVLLLFVSIVIYSYSINLKYFLSNENAVLISATEGDLNGQVTVSSNDEFGVMAHHTNLMINSLLKRTEELQLTQDVTILSLASLAETRDNETGAHIKRTQRYVRALAEQLRHHENFKHELNERSIDLLYKSAPLHDIGKVGIPDRILLKPDKLDNDEFKIMKTHAELGGQALHVAEQGLGSTSFLQYAREIATTHHEKWNGSGYPNGLKELEIPISGRLMAVADVYDALISERVYKKAFSHEKAMDILVEGRGEHFDPDIIDALLEIEDEFISIAKEFQG